MRDNISYRGIVGTFYNMKTYSDRLTVNSPWRTGTGLPLLEDPGEQELVMFGIQETVAWEAPVWHPIDVSQLVLLGKESGNWNHQLPFLDV
jgi:hypothetical protein